MSGSAEPVCNELRRWTRRCGVLVDGVRGVGKANERADE